MAKAEARRAPLARKPQYLVDDDGSPVGVILNIDDYRRLLDELEDLESIRAYDEAKSSNDEAIPLDQAFDEIERERGWRTQ